MKTFLSKIQETIDNSGSLTAGEMIQRLNQQIKGWTMYHRYAASKRTFTYVDHRIFQNGVAVVPATAPEQEPEVDQGEILPARRSSPLGLHRSRCANPKGQGWPIQLMAAATVKIIRYVKIRSAVNPYDPQWELYLEARWGWQLSPDADRSQPDRILLEETKGTMHGLRSTAANRRGRLSDPSSHLAQPRRSGHGRQHGVVACQLPSADPRARTTDQSGRVPRGAFVKA